MNQSINKITQSLARAMRPALGIGICALLCGCRPGDLLAVDPPLGVQAGTPVASLEGAEAAYAGAKSDMFNSVAGVYNLVQLSGLLSDEFVQSAVSFLSMMTNVDARATTASAYTSAGDFQSSTAAALLGARSELLVAQRGLTQYEPANGQAKAGEAYALVGYVELLLAEDYCAGVPLSRALSTGGLEYGIPLSTDSLLGVAEAHFDSALAHANGDTSIQALARVGLGRVHINRGHFEQAETAVASVPTSFVYNIELQPTFNGPPNFVNWYANQILGCGEANVANREGGNGLNYRSAQDPRLVLDSTINITCDGQDGVGPTTWFYPVKFGNPSRFVPLATGVEARLIEAEAALHAGQISAWAAGMNALRAVAPNTYLHLASPMLALSTDSTINASASTQVDVLFRERAFWLFGTGTRLGDMRRLIRQYSRDANSVFPTGSYPLGTAQTLPAPLSNYDTDVSLTLPTAVSGPTTNPHYHGCLTSPSTA